jgi:hypothetical protein
MLLSVTPENKIALKNSPVNHPKDIPNSSAQYPVPNLTPWARPSPPSQSQHDALQLYKAYMENRHYLRVKAVAGGQAKLGCVKSTFFSLYSQFLVSWKHMAGVTF